MTTIRRLTALLAVPALCAAVLGCRPTPPPTGTGAAPASGPGAADTAAGDKTLTLAWVYQIDTLDPAKAYILPSWDTDRSLYEGLLDYDLNSLDLRPAAAEGYDVSDDGTVYTFHLKPDLKFSDGTPVTAQDFRYAWMRVLDPKTASPGAQFFTGIVGAQDYLDGKATDVPGIEVPDPRTLKVTLVQPDLAFANIVAMNFAFPLPKKAVEDLGDKWGTAELVGNGRYMLSEWRKGELIVLKRNPSYAGDPPKIDEIRYILGQESPAIVQRFEAGEVDILQDVPPGDFTRLQQDPKYQDCWVSMQQGAVRYLCMNVEEKPFGNIKVREAVAHAVNKERLIKLMNGRAVVANGVFPPTLPQFNPDLKAPDYDLEKSKALLAEAGLPDGFRTDMYYYQEETRQKLAEAIQSDLAAVGIKVTLRPVQREVFANEAGIAHKYPFMIAEWYQDYPDPSNYLDVLLHSRQVRAQASNNFARYKNPKVDAVIDEARAEADPQKRTELYREAEEIAMADVPWVPLHHEKAYILHQPNVTGVTLHPVSWIRLELVDKKG